jgi:hypothetical protein
MKNRNAQNGTKIVTRLWHLKVDAEEARTTAVTE